jgi:predicted enzyme related to lactoylglutathione lyase
MNPVVHFEMPANDRERMAEFYTAAFGWQAQLLGPEMGNYVLVTTSERNPNGRPKEPGTINGGFYPKTADMPAQYPSVVIAVENIQESMRKITASGGQLLGEPVMIPGNGWYVSFLDTEGNRVSLMEPIPM